MKLPPLVLVGLVSVLVTVPSPSQPPPSARPPVVVRLEPLKRFTPPSPPPAILTPEQDRRSQLTLVDHAVRGDAESTALMAKVDIWLYHPANESYRPKTPEAAVLTVQAARRAMRYELDGYQAPALSGHLLEMIGVPSQVNPFGEVKQKLPLSVQKGLAVATDKGKERMEKAVPWLKRVGKAVPYLEVADQALGERLAKDLYELQDKPALQFLDDCVRRAAPPTLDSALKPTATANRGSEAVGRLIAGAGGGDKVAAALVDDRSPFGLNVAPAEPDKKLKENPRYAGVLEAEAIFAKSSGRPASDINPYRPERTGPGRGPASNPSAGEQRALAAFAREMKLYRDALDRNTAELKEVRAEQANTAAQLADINKKLTQLTEQRTDLVQKFAHGAELALQCLSNLGVDPALVRDLTVVTKAGLQVAAGVAMAVANIYNPIGWLTILGGITSLFNTGPDPMQLVLEQLAAIRRDLADFRYEMRLTLAELRQEVRVGFEKTLGRINDLEYHLTTQLQAVQTQAEWNEYRLNRIEGQISALGQQILTRFAELQQRDVVALLASQDLDRKAFAGLSAAPGGSELLKARYHDAVAVAYASAVHHAANWSLAKGDTEVPGAYGTVTPTLSEGNPRLLLAAVQDPAAPWANVNDFARLARTADPGLLAPPAPGGKSDLKLVPDRTRLVNPLAWNVASGAFLDLAVDGRDYFTNRKDLVRGLAEVYRRGEEFNDATHRIGTADKGGVFAQLTSTQLKAVDTLEELLTAKGKTVIGNLGQNPWAGISQPLPDGRYVHWDGPVNTSVKGLADDRIDNAWLGDAKLDFPTAELESLIGKGVMPKPFASASLIKPADGRGGDQSVFGGTIRLTLSKIDVPMDGDSPHVKHRWSRRESTGFLGTGPGKYHPNLLYEGPVYVTLEGHYQTSRQTGDYLIFRHRLPTKTLVRFQREAHPDGTYDHWHYTSARGFELAVGLHQGRLPWVVSKPAAQPGPSFPVQVQNPEVDEMLKSRAEGFQPLATVAADWSILREELAKRPTDWTNPGPGATPAAAVERAVAQRFDFEVLDDKQKNAKAVFHGLTDVGDQIREVVGCQGLMLRYVQLALPEAQSDPELLALLMGDQAAWGGSAIADQFRLTPADKSPFMKEVKDGAGKVVGYEPTVTGKMRAQTLKLQAKLAELVARKRADPVPARHPAVEGMLLRIAFTARSLGIDLEAELTAAGVTVPEHWTCRQLNKLSPTPRREDR